MLEGRDGVTRDADRAVVLLEERTKDRDAQAMWLLGLCCEYGMGTEQDTQRAQQLYQQAAQQGNKTAQLLADNLLRNGRRGCLRMLFEGEQPHSTTLLLWHKHINSVFLMLNNFRRTHWTWLC